MFGVPSISTPGLSAQHKDRLQTGYLKLVACRVVPICRLTNRPSQSKPRLPADSKDCLMNQLVLGVSAQEP